MTTSDERLQAVCPRCHQAVRVPRARLADRPRCPACKADLFDGRALDLGDADFDAVVARTDLPVLVDFWAAWCGPCRAFAPILEQVAADTGTRLVVARVDTDAAPRLSARHAIRSIPTIVLFRAGREIARASGAMPLAALRDWLRQHAGLSAAP